MAETKLSDLEQLLAEKHAIRDALHLARGASCAQVLTEIGAMKDRLRAVAQRRRRQRLIDRQKLGSA